MVFRAIICCAALVLGLLAALSATAQSANAPQPLNLMSFMQGSAKAGSVKSGSAEAGSAKTASKAKHLHAVAKTAARSYRHADDPSHAPSEPQKLPAAAASAYASQSTENVLVVSGDEVNAIDMAMNGSAAETTGAASRIDNDTQELVKWADAAQFRASQSKPAGMTAPSYGTTGSDTPRDDSWIGRFWSAIGDGYLALVEMLKRLFF